MSEKEQRSILSNSGAMNRQVNQGFSRSYTNGKIYSRFSDYEEWLAETRVEPELVNWHDSDTFACTVKGYGTKPKYREDIDRMIHKLFDEHGVTHSHKYELDKNMILHCHFIFQRTNPNFEETRPFNFRYWHIYWAKLKSPEGYRKYCEKCSVTPEEQQEIFHKHWDYHNCYFEEPKCYVRKQKPKKERDIAQMLDL